MKRIIKILVLSITIGLTFQLSAQDFHLSQYDAAALNTNPALTGMLKENIDCTPIIEHNGLLWLLDHLLLDC